MINHIVKLIWNQRKSNGWLFGELLLVAVCLWYIVDYLLVVVYTFNAPLGFDISHTYQFQFGAREEGAEGYMTAEEHPATAGEDLWEVMERMRRYSGVETVAVSRMALPYNTIDNYMFLSRDTISRAVPCRVFYVSPEYMDVFRIHTSSKSLRKLKDGLSNQMIAITEDAADELFGENGAVGQNVYTGNGNEIVKVGAVSQAARPSEFSRIRARIYVPLSEQNIKSMQAGALPWLEISVRVKPDADKDFADTFMKNSNQVEIGNLYLQNIVPVAALREDGIREGMGEMNTRLSILFFLLINIFLGIIGTFWFRTHQRMGEMGLRMALGSTRNQLRSTVFGEGILLLTIAFIPALAICFNIMRADLTNTVLMDNTALRFMLGMLITYLLIVLMIIVGIWYPANKAASLEPAEALHYE